MTNLKYILLFLFVGVQLYGQKHQVSGIVYDNETREKLIGASVVEIGTKNGISTNNNGYFSMQIDHDSLVVSFVGYQSQRIMAKKDTLIEIYMEPGAEIEEIRIVHSRFTSTNISRLTNKEIMRIPSLTGKPDVVKALQLTPGITTQAEGTSILNVRGGNPGENLYLIDDVPLIYVNHIGGFFSVFNPDMINNIDVYKSDFPAKYGGKLSSVLSITQREGDKKSWKGNLAIGVTDASFTLEGPIVNEKMSLIVNGRKTFIDPIMALITGMQGSDYFLYYGFHDLNAKLSYRPNKSNSFNANIYFGDDYLSYHLIPRQKDEDKMNYINRWGNYMVSGKWSKVINDKIFVNNTLSVTKYQLQVKNKYISGRDTSENRTSTIQSYVQDISLRSDWNYHPVNRLNIDFGLNMSSLSNMPNKIIAGKNSVGGNNPMYAFEASLYQNCQLNITHSLKFDLGLRFVNYFKNEYTRSFLEPRLSLSFLFANQKLAINYQEVNQTSHLLLTSGAIFNNEVWITADKDLPPSHSQQYSFSWNTSFVEGRYSAELNVYKKYSENLAIYKEGYSTILGDGNWKSKVETGGIGKSKGVEVFLKKNTGNWNGFLSYTFSKTTRQFSGINNGNEFIYDYDRPHSFSASFNYRFNKKLDFNLVWVYQTGLPYTPVIARHLSYVEGEEVEVLVYGKRNSARMKNYHRMDAALRYTTTNKKGRRVEWCFSVYNLYNQKNANSYFYGYAKNYYLLSQLPELKQLKQYQNSFFPIIPMISYRVNFDDIKFGTKKNTGKK